MAPPSFTDLMPEIAASMRSAGQPMALLASVDSIVSREIGRIFSTFLMVHPDGEGERIFSSDPQTFPLGGRKPMLGREWSDHVIGRAKPFLARTMEEIRSSTLDSGWVDRLGCRCLLNMPIVHDGTVVGTFNVGVTENRFQEADIRRVETLATFIGPSLAWLRLKATGASASDRPIESTEI